GSMYSKPVTNRKSFLKRAVIAIAGVFAYSSAPKSNSRTKHGVQTITTSQCLPNSAMVRVRKAKGALARKV
ncbi:MAG: hypothetical protein VX051_00685, partial [Verrucomicrobiota bacterium]|nr:hypothetical protein [Verrucomicrobiota bacterium]